MDVKETGLVKCSKCHVITQPGEHNCRVNKPAIRFSETASGVPHKQETLPALNARQTGRVLRDLQERRSKQQDCDKDEDDD